MKTIDKLIKILDLLAENPSGLTRDQFIDELEIPDSTMHRLLKTLERHNVLKSEYVGKKKKYKIGLKILEYSSAFVKNNNLVNSAYPLMEQLMSDLGKTIHLAVPNEHRVVYVNTALNPNSPKLSTEIGKQVPMYCTALGKAMLASMDTSRRRALLGKMSYKKHTSNTITGRDKLEEELLETRERGFAIDDEEWDVGVRCVAVPIKDHFSQVVAALSTAAPKEKINRSDFESLGSRLKEAAEKISQNTT